MLQANKTQQGKKILQLVLSFKATPVRQSERDKLKERERETNTDRHNKCLSLYSHSIILPFTFYFKLTSSATAHQLARITKYRTNTRTHHGHIDSSVPISNTTASYPVPTSQTKSNNQKKIRLQPKHVFIFSVTLTVCCCCVSFFPYYLLEFL